MIASTSICLNLLHITSIHFRFLKTCVTTTSKQLQYSAFAASKLQAFSNKPQHLNFTFLDLLKHNLLDGRTIGKGNKFKACQNNVSDNRILYSLHSPFLHHIVVA